MTGNNKLINKLTTNSNQVGIAFFFTVSSLTNDNEIDLGTLAKMHKMQTIKNLPTGNSSEQFSPIDHASFSLISERPIVDEQQVILDFANKLLGESHDIDPEISRVIQKRFWDMV